MSKFKTPEELIQKPDPEAALTDQIVADVEFAITTAAKKGESVAEWRWNYRSLKPAGLDEAIVRHLQAAGWLATVSGDGVSVAMPGSTHTR